MYYKRTRGKDPRYETAKFMLEAGKIKTLWHLTKIVPKTLIAVDLGVKSDRFTDCLRDTSMFKMKHVYDMAELFDVDVKILTNIMADHWMETRDKAKLHQSFLGYNKKAIS